MLKNLNGAASSNPSNFTEVNGKIIFVATEAANGYELYVTDGTEAGTMLLKDINPGISNGLSSYQYLHKYNGKVYFKATDGVNGDELWVTDGTSAGTMMLKNISSSGNSNPNTFTEFNGKFYFTATTPAYGSEP